MFTGWDIYGNDDCSGGSSIARRILADWDSYVKKFVKVIPKDYKRVTEKVAQYLQSGMSEQEATIKVFEEVQA